MATFWFHNPKNPVQIWSLQPDTAIKPYLYRFSGRKGLIWAVGEIGKRNGFKLRRSLYLARSSRVLPTRFLLESCYLNLIHLNKTTNFAPPEYCKIWFSCFISLSYFYLFLPHVSRAFSISKGSWVPM